MNGTKQQVFLSLEPEYYDRLSAFAKRNHWSMATAARVIVMERLDTEKEAEEG